MSHEESSNEAGLGTGSIAHACADTKEPVKQGLLGIFEVFTDTILICTLTALVILCSGIQLDLVRMLVLNLRSVDLLLLMVTGSPSLLQLRYVALHFQPLSDGDYMELVVLSFYSLLRLSNLLC